MFRSSLLGPEFREQSEKVARDAGFGRDRSSQCAAEPVAAGSGVDAPWEQHFDVHWIARTCAAEFYFSFLA
jgi:hypothetical protein